MSLSTSSSDDSAQVSHSKGDLSSLFSIERSTLHARWLEEQDHIERNRWYLSEKLGFDCGRGHAVWDWNMRWRDRWLADWRARHEGE